MSCSTTRVDDDDDDEPEHPHTQSVFSWFSLDFGLVESERCRLETRTRYTHRRLLLLLFEGGRFSRDLAFAGDRSVENHWHTFEEPTRLTLIPEPDGNSPKITSADGNPDSNPDVG